MKKTFILTLLISTLASGMQQPPLSAPQLEEDVEMYNLAEIDQPACFFDGTVEWLFRHPAVNQPDIFLQYYSQISCHINGDDRLNLLYKILQECCVLETGIRAETISAQEKAIILYRRQALFRLFTLVLMDGGCSDEVLAQFVVKLIDIKKLDNLRYFFSVLYPVLIEKCPRISYGNAVKCIQTALEKIPAARASDIVFYGENESIPHYCFSEMVKLMIKVLPDYFSGCFNFDENKECACDVLSDRHAYGVADNEADSDLLLARAIVGQMIAWCNSQYNRPINFLVGTDISL